MTLRSLFGRTASTLLMLSLAACGGGGGDSPPATFSIGGTVTGLASGTEIVLNNNGNPPLTVSANGAFTLTQAAAANGSYLVTINTQPTGQTCSVANFQGAGVTANVSNVNVTCSPVTHIVGGSITGLAAGQQVTLNNNGADALAVSADSAFTFVMPVPFNGSYAVTVGTQPTGQTCTVSNGSGSGVVADVSNVAVTCSTNIFSVGGTLAGLAAGQQVTLNNNSSDPLTVNADGTFTFVAPVTYNGSYAVTVGTQPNAGKTCTVSNGSGSGVVANITNVTVACSTNTYTIGATVSGLVAGEQVTLTNGGNPLTVTFAQQGALRTFSTPVTYNGSYAVTVGTQPNAGKTCTVSNGSGSGVVANITNVTVACSTNNYAIGGTITGLISTQQVTLNNNGGDPLTLTVGSGGTFTFATPVAFGTGYAVTVGTSPTGETCRITNGTGTNVAADVSTVSINCRLALAYVVNSTDHTISQYTIGLDGSLTEIGTPIDTLGTNPNVVTVDPKGRFAYVTNYGSNTVAQFAIDAATGALTSLGAPLPTGPTPYSVVSTGSYAYVTNQDDPRGTNSSVSQFIVGSDGSLTANGSFTLPTGSTPYAITVDPTDHHAYVANRGTSKISQFNIDGTTGALVPMSTPEVILTPGTGPLAVTIDPTGTYAYSDNFDAKTVTTFSIDGSTGALAAVTSTAPSVNGPYPVAISPNGSYAYWSVKFDSQVVQCFLAVRGALDCSAGAIGAGAQPQYVAIDPFSKHVYAVNFSSGGLGAVSQYDITPADGRLTNNAVPTVGTGNGPFSITTTR